MILLAIAFYRMRYERRRPHIQWLRPRSRRLPAHDVTRVEMDIIGAV
jgi:hypothetical protein